MWATEGIRLLGSSSFCQPGPVLSWVLQGRPASGGAWLVTEGLGGVTHTMTTTLDASSASHPSFLKLVLAIVHTCIRTKPF